MDLTLLSQADAATLKLELAKLALETAKAQLEEAKQGFEALLTQADERGVPRAKLKKLAEDRVQALFDSGILGTMGYGEGKLAGEGKRERTRKPARKPEEDGNAATETAEFLAEKSGGEAAAERSA